MTNLNNTQCRKFLMTQNNPIAFGMTDDLIREKLGSLGVDFACWASEKGLKEETEHKHIFIQRSTPWRFSTVQRKFPHAHIESAHASSSKCRDYVKKGGKWENDEKHDTIIKGTYHEIGELPDEEHEDESRNERILRMVKEGYSTSEIIDDNAKNLTMVSKINEYREEYLWNENKGKMRDVEVTYIYGQTAVGKNKYVYKHHNIEDVFVFSNYDLRNGTKFDEYKHEDVFVFDEFRSQIPISQMLKYLDLYPLVLPARYKNKVALFTKVYVLTNIPIEQQYPDINKNSETWKAFIRRFKKIYLMKDGGKLVDETNKYKEEGKGWRQLTESEISGLDF